MKVITQILILAVLGGATTFLPAQTKMAPGYYISNDQDTIWGQFEIPIQYVNEEPVLNVLQWRVLFFEGEKAVELVLKPENCKGYAFELEENTYAFKRIVNSRKWRNPFKEEYSHVFVNLLAEGKLDLIGHFRIFSEGGFQDDGMGGGFGYGDTYNHLELYISKNDELFKINDLGWRKQLKELMAEDEQTMSVLEQRNFKKRDLAILINDFNEGRKN